MSRLPFMSGHRWMRALPEAESTDVRVNEPALPEDEGGALSAWRFRLAVLGHGKIVYRVAYSFLRDRHEAEDVTQEAFLRLWQHGAAVRRQREWLLAVARNACLDRLRRTRPTTGIDGMETDGDERGPMWHLQQHELADRLNALVAALPEPQRSLVVLFDMQGLDGAACARILGLNVNQVKVYLHRARRRLRRALEESA